MAKTFNSKAKLKIYHIFDILYNNNHDEDFILELIDDLPESQINCKDEYDYTLLMLLIKSNYYKAAENIVYFPNIDINGKNIFGDTALIMCIRKDILNYSNDDYYNFINKLLLHPNIDINIRTNLGNSAFMISHTNFGKNERIVNLLFDHPSLNINLQDDATYNTLQCSISNGHNIKSMKILTHPSLDINYVNQHGITALMIAMHYDQVELIEMMLKNPNIDVNIRSNQGKLAEEYGREDNTNRNKIIEMIQNYRNSHYLILEKN